MYIPHATQPSYPRPQVPPPPTHAVVALITEWERERKRERVREIQ